MLKIKHRIYIYFFAVLSLLFASIALFIKYTLIEIELPKDFWFSYLELLFILYVVGYFFIRRFVLKLDRDIDALTNFLEELNDKNYDAHLEIHHNMEFLKISVLLKNIVKRLYKKKK